MDRCLVDPPRVPPHRTHLHHATILLRNKILASAYNRIGSRTRGCGWSDRSICAERNAIKSLGDFRKLRGATLIVVRYGPDGTLRPSAPCHDCQYLIDKCIREYGLRKVIWS